MCQDLIAAPTTALGNRCCCPHFTEEELSPKCIESLTWTTQPLWGRTRSLREGLGKGIRITEGQKDRVSWDPAGRREKSCRARGMLEAMARGALEAAS